MGMESSSEIGNFVWSDHAPVFLILEVLGEATIKGSWRLNDNLLNDEICTSEIGRAIKKFVIGGAGGGA